MIRKKARRVTCLKDMDDNLVENIEHLKYMARNFYEKLYAADEYDDNRQPYLDFFAL